MVTVRVREIQSTVTFPFFLSTWKLCKYVTDETWTVLCQSKLKLHFWSTLLEQKSRPTIGLNRHDNEMSTIIQSTPPIHSTRLCKQWFVIPIDPTPRWTQNPSACNQPADSVGTHWRKGKSMGRCTTQGDI